MRSITEVVNPPQALPHTEICALGHPLGDCPAKRAGCRNHYEMLQFMFPPLRVVSHVRATMSTDPDAQRWLARLDAVLPGQRNARGGR